MKYIAGFIGVGNMGGALLEAVSSVKESRVAVFDINKNLADEKAEKCGAVSCSLEEVVSNSKYIFLGVKPNIILSLAKQIKEFICKDSIVVTMAAGIATEQLSAVLDNRIIRIMPNTPVTVGQGMVLYCMGSDIDSEQEKDFLNIMSKVGTLDKIDEKLIDAAAALSGCGPAFVYMFIDALADGAVKCGLPREKALLYAKQTVMGSACYSMQSEKHPDKLKDEVCSPGGTTIEGVLALEKGAFRHAVSSAVISAYEKTKLL